MIVGNITVGGSGKTPLVAALVAALAQRGFHPGVVSRGYGRDRGRRCADRRRRATTIRAGSATSRCCWRAPAARWPSRAIASPPVWRCLSRNPECDVILADDGLQHYRLERNVEIAVVDAARALGNGWLLPAGPLREPATRLDEVDAVVMLVSRGKSSRQPCGRARSR